MRRVISRRSFLTTATAAIGAFEFLPARALGKAGFIAPSKRITLGVIGLGIQGTGDMKTFLAMSDIQVVAVCDVHEGQNAKGKQVVDTWRTTRLARPAKTFVN